MKQIARLGEKLLADANDSATAEEIVKLYVVEFDDPKAALPFLNRVKDEQLKKLVALAAGEPVEMGDHLALGQWYRTLAGVKPGIGEIPLLLHAEHHLHRFVTASETSTAQTDALQVSKARLLLKEIGSLKGQWIGATFDADALLILSFDNRSMKKRDNDQVVMDGSTSGHDAVLKGGKSVNGVIGQALQFDGDTYVSLDASPKLNIRENLTVAFWIKPASLNGNRGFIVGNRPGPEDIGLGFESHLEKSRLKFFSPGDGQINLQVDLTHDGWQHIAFSYDGRKGSLHLDGKLVHEGTGGARASREVWHMGKTLDGREGLQAALDEVRIYGRALSADEIEKLHRSQKPGR